MLDEVKSIPFASPQGLDFIRKKLMKKPIVSKSRNVRFPGLYNSLDFRVLFSFVTCVYLGPVIDFSDESWKTKKNLLDSV